MCTRSFDKKKLCLELIIRTCFIFFYIFFCYLWNRRTYNLAKATGFLSSVFWRYYCFIYLYHAVIGALHSSSPVRLPLRMQWWIHAIWFGLYLCRWLSLFILLHSSRLFTQMVIFSSALSLPLPFFLSLCLKIKTTFRGDREIDHVDKRSAWLQPWRCGSSFSLSLYSPRDKLLISVGSMITSCIQSEQLF